MPEFWRIVGWKCKNIDAFEGDWVKTGRIRKDKAWKAEETLTNSFFEEKLPAD